MVHVNPPTTTKVVLDESWWSLGIIQVIWKQVLYFGISNFRFWQLFRGGRPFGRNLRSRAQLRAKEGRRIRLEDCFFKTRNHEKSKFPKSKLCTPVMFLHSPRPHKCIYDDSATCFAMRNGSGHPQQSGHPQRFFMISGFEKTVFEPDPPSFLCP